MFVVFFCYMSVHNSRILNFGGVFCNPTFIYYKVLLPSRLHLKLWVGVSMCCWLLFLSRSLDNMWFNIYRINIASTATNIPFIGQPVLSLLQVELPWAPGMYNWVTIAYMKYTALIYVHGTFHSECAHHGSGCVSIIDSIGVLSW